jgi:hypothetical protein
MASLKGFDLVVFDHFHYIDAEYGNEIENHKRMIKQFRDLIGAYGIPIVLLAHLRKSDKRFQSPVPDMEEFQGTSDIYKNPTKIILVAPGPKYFPADGTLKNAWTTYFNIAKVRRDGSRTKFIGKTAFDLSTTSYIDQFTLGTFRDKEWEPIDPDHIPHWAKEKAKQEQPIKPKTKEVWEQKAPYTRFKIPQGDE